MMKGNETKPTEAAMLDPPVAGTQSKQVFARALISLSLGLCVAGTVGCMSGPHPRPQTNPGAAAAPREDLMANETEEFLKYMLPKQIAAERAIHAGNVEPRLALWSHRDPVTLRGAKLSGKGWADVSAKFRTVASWFSDTTSYEFEVIAAGASGDLAFIVGYEHNVVKVNGVPKTYTLRSTHVYRREDGEWKIVHRHADAPPSPDVQIGGASR
jgi:ketosteroid isomerase-like protein